MAKHKLGQRVYVALADGTGHAPVTIAGRENHNHFEFYRVKEMPGSLFLSKSLLTEARINLGRVPGK